MNNSLKKKCKETENKQRQRETLGMFDGEREVKKNHNMFFKTHPHNHTHPFMHKRSVYVQLHTTHTDLQCILLQLTLTCYQECKSPAEHY